MASKKDYIGVAGAIKKTKTLVDQPDVIEKYVEQELMKFFAKDNPRFDKKIFKKACSL
tara:strand:- start:4132 stop:4305 length:174 start_codon:yes stop_codon:yes gene_type:complete